MAVRTYHHADVLSRLWNDGQRRGRLLGVVSDRPVRVGLIGAGRMGRAHLKAMADARNVQTAAVVEPVERIREELAALGIRTFADVDALLEAGDVDAVIVAAPTDLHLELVTALARAGLPTLCEKPCGLRSEETAEAVRIAADAGIVLQIGYWRRFVPALVGLRERIAAGALGEPAQIWSWQWDERPPTAAFRARSGGILLDMGVHEFDQIRWLTGQELGDITAIAATVTSEAAVPGDPESVAAVVELSGGAVATVSVGRRLSVCEGCWVEVVGTEGHAREVFVWGDDGPGVIHAAVVAQLEAFVAAVGGAPQQGATGEDALRAIETAERAARSLAVGAEA
jgi:myo-inositol 2-dehydrogenase/D-chiro-inositol 1-dehydrogenase